MAVVEEFGFADTVFLSDAGLGVAWTGFEVIPILIFFPEASAAGSVVDVDLTLPEDAVVRQAHFGLAAEPVVPAVISSVATVRPATALGSNRVACTVDFGHLVTVARVGSHGPAFIPTIQSVYRWTGAAWQFVANSASFAELAAERLLLEANATDVTAAQLAEAISTNGAVDLPAVPTALELQVNGVTVWFERQGSAPITLPPPVIEGVGTRYVVDRTTAIADAFSAAPTAEATRTRTVRVSLRAAAPGLLTLAPSIFALRVHTVAFPPDGLVRSVDVFEEGVYSVDVTPPGAEDVREVRGVVRGSFGAERVQPAVGPALQPDAHLVLAPARPVLVGLPDVLTSRFGKLTGVRLALRAVEDTNGGEVTGRLLADVAGAPGRPIPGGDLESTTVGPGPERYHTLRFSEEVEPPTLPPAAVPLDAGAPPRISCWLELQLGHGAVECAFTGAHPNDASAPGGLVLRRLPGGGTAELTEIPTLGPLRAAIRVVGVADRDRPIPCVLLSVRGSTDAVGVNPTADDLTTRVTLSAPLPVAGPVAFDAVIAAPGTLTLDTLQVTYKELE